MVSRSFLVRAPCFSYSNSRSRKQQRSFLSLLALCLVVPTSSSFVEEKEKDISVCSIIRIMKQCLNGFFLVVSLDRTTERFCW